MARRLKGCDNVPFVAKERRLTPHTSPEVATVRCSTTPRIRKVRRILSGESTVVTVSMHAERLRNNFGGGRGVVAVALVDGR